eukprot:TRINITY_DN15034_c0_g1_i1.p1 TRINITY_DN15034_c0_g1~~TRINITY_DN15034_c0_g1_i1.p1  ORF type:complete len:206 (+),score=93.01 TRINITY_DN15034_c0_g1_i1:46-663(+)
METSIGICFKDHVIVACSGAAAFYYFLLQEKEDKLVEIDSHKVAAAVGEQSDRVRLLQYIRCAMKPAQIQSGKALSTSSVAHFMRSHMAQSLRSRRGMYAANMMFAGYDLPQSETGDESPTGPSLYWIDYLAAMQKVNYGVHGYGGSFITSVLDAKYSADMSEEEGIQLLKACIATVNKRLIMTQGTFVCKVIDKNGTRVIDLEA